MESLILEPTDITFGVTLDKDKGIFRFEGKSRPENAISFFDPVFEWFDKYQYITNEETIIEFKLDYFNSSTAKILLRFLAKLEAMAAEGKKVAVHWFYRENDEDLLEAGEDFSSLIDLPFKFYSIS